MAAQLKQIEGKTDKGFSFDGLIFGLIEDTPENLRELLNRTIKTVNDDRKGKISGINPYNSISYHLNPKPWYYSGIPAEYYDQRITIYQYVLRLVDETRGNFASSKMCEFTSDIERYINNCKEYKQELKEAEEHSRWIRRNL